MSHPKFQSQDVRTATRLGLEPLGSEWAKVAERVRDSAATMPAGLRSYFDVHAAFARRKGRLRHNAYLERTGGNFRTEVEDVTLMWSCCGREELLPEVHYDRHGDLRPEDKAIILARGYYHQC